MEFLGLLANIAGIIGAAIIIIGISIGLVRFIFTEFKSLKPARKHMMTLDEMRRDMGHYMLLGVDFLVASDLILTVVEPNLQELAILGGLVVIRAVIGYFIHKEIHEEDKIPGSAAATENPQWLSSDLKARMSNVSTSDDLIADYRFELVEDHHHPGSGRYGIRVILLTDISSSFPYLNAVLDDTIYDHENRVLIGAKESWRYAFRPHEILIGAVENPDEASSVAKKVVELVNKVWREHELITPNYKERKLPAVYEIYQLLPKINCGECGYSTCMVFASDIRNGVEELQRCPLMTKPEYAGNKERILNLFSSD